MRKIVFLCFALGVSLSGCSENNRKDIEQKPIELNNGEKWSVDTAMLEHITAMETAVNGFTAGDDINSLKKALKVNLRELTSKCTMQGQAHDELHKWLMPVIETVNKMGSGESLDRLRQQFKTFHTYFE